MFGDVTEMLQYPKQWILCSALDSTAEPELTRGALEKSLKSKENKNKREKLYFEFYRV